MNPWELTGFATGCFDNRSRVSYRVLIAVISLYTVGGCTADESRIANKDAMNKQAYPFNGEWVAVRLKSTHPLHQEVGLTAGVFLFSRYHFKGHQLHVGRESKWLQVTLTPVASGGLTVADDKPNLLHKAHFQIKRKRVELTIASPPMKVLLERWNTGQNEPTKTICAPKSVTKQTIECNAMQCTTTICSRYLTGKRSQIASPG